MFIKSDASVVVVTVVPAGETLKPSLLFTSTEKLLSLGMYPKKHLETIYIQSIKLIGPVLLKI